MPFKRDKIVSAFTLDFDKQNLEKIPNFEMRDSDARAR